MFRVIEDPQFVEDVKVDVPDGSGWRSQVLRTRFRALKVADMETLEEDGGARALLDRAVVGFEDLVDDAGSPVDGTGEWRVAPVEVHGLLIDPVQNTIVGTPWLALRGWVDEVEIRTPGVDGEGGVDLRIASAARALTRTLSLKRGDASHQLRGGDRFRRYAEISGTASVSWGEQ